PKRNVRERARLGRLFEQSADSRLEGGPHRRCAGRHWISQPKAPPERQRAFLLSARDGDAWRAARRLRGIRSGLRRQRAVGWVLGIWLESLGHGGRNPLD